jgi:ABC-type arginine transport system permease subunit
MALLEIKKEIGNELKDSGAWAEQIGNVFHAILWTVGTWLSISTVMLGLVASLIIFSGEIDATYSTEDLTSIFNVIMVGVYSIVGIVVLLFGLPKRVRNVFKDIAFDRVNRQKSMFDQADLIESVLIRHEIINDEQAKQAKLARENS